MYEICHVYNIEYNIQQIYNNKHQVDNIVQINSKRYIICLCYNIDMRPMNYCKIGKTFYTRCVVYKIYDNYIRFRTRMWYMTKWYESLHVWFKDIGYMICIAGA